MLWQKIQIADKNAKVRTKQEQRCNKLGIQVVQTAIGAKGAQL